MSVKAGARRATPKTGDGTAAPRERSRIPPAERKAQILREAGALFAEEGLAAQTRALADRCGISQRLLYRYFPTKRDLLAEVYRNNIAGPFKAVWFAGLQDRSIPVEARLNVFYKDYVDTVLTRQWLRLFIYSSLADFSMAPDYISDVIKQLVEIIVQEVAAAQGVTPPADRAVVHELGWTLHGAISHYAIRRHLYGASQALPEEKVIALHVRTFVAGLAPSIALSLTNEA